MKLIVGLVLIGLVVLYQAEFSSSAKILFLLPIASKSHYNVFEPLLLELAKRKHEIVLMSPYKPSKLPSNVESVIPVSAEKMFEKLPTPFEMRKMGKIQMMSYFDVFDDSCHAILKNKRVKELLKESFDLIFIDIFLNLCSAGMLDHFKSPYIYVNTSPATNDITEHAGTHLPPSFVPSTYLSYSDEMDFSERFGNTVLQWLIRGAQVLVAPKTEKIYKEHLGQETASLSEIHGNVSMIFVNSHFIMNYPRPFLPDIVEVGGMHCRPANPLPKDLEDFMNGSGEDGVILFSLGSIAQGSDMSEENRKTFLNVFSKLKQRVIWKWETETMDGLPSNVMLKKFVPQQDLLGHPKIRLFMTHGGLLSIQESVYHGVPLLTIPLFADQDLNALKAEKAGFSLTVEIDTMNEESLEEKIHNILQEPKFSARAKQLSILTQDQPETPLTRAVYWSEYVIRHKGAIHLRSAGRELNIFQFHSLDVIASLIGILLIMVFLIVGLCKKIINLVRHSSGSVNENQVRQMNSKKRN